MGRAGRTPGASFREGPVSTPVRIVGNGVDISDDLTLADELMTLIRRRGGDRPLDAAGSLMALGALAMAAAAIIAAGPDRQRAREVFEFTYFARMEMRRP